MKSYLSRDDGAIAVVSAVLLSLAMLFLSAIVVDAGFLYDTRSQLQSAADAGALEGCRVLSATSSAAQADAAARTAAMENAVGPGGNLVVTAVNIDMSDYSVQVEVAADANMYFSKTKPGGAAGPATRRVVAAARARRTLLTGARYLVPWGIPIIENVDHAEARINGVSYPLTGAGTTFEGDVPIPAGGGDVQIHIFNQYGVDEVLIDDAAAKPAPAIRLNEASAGYPFTDIQLSDDYIPSDAYSSPTITVRTAAPQTSVRAYVGGNFVSLTNVGGGTLWSGTLPSVTLTNDLMISYPIDVRIGATKDAVPNDSYLHVRRSTNPYQDVFASTYVGPAGSFSHVTVNLSYFDPSDAIAGKVYTLRVGQQSNLSGNFAEINYNTIIHQADCPPDPVPPAPGNQYYDWVVEGYPGGVHVGDIVTTSPGGSGINTQKALAERLAQDPYSKLIVEVPIVEKYEDKSGGAYDLIVLKFASFELSNTGDKSGNVTGTFIEYIANPSSFGSGSGGTSGVYAPRLINPQ